MKIVLGVDAGGSKTHALVADERGFILGFGQGGPGNHQVSGLEQAMEEIARASGEALAQASASLPVEVGLLGLAGADLPMDYAMLTTAVSGLGLARKVHIKNDTMVALRAGLKRSWGVAVICGAGFNAGGIGPDGQEVQLPGLGPLSGDWGGGGDIALEAIRLVCRAWDGRGEPTMLTEMVLAALELPTVEELISRLYQSQAGYPGDQPGRMEPLRLLSLVPCVFEAALAGDRPSQQLLVRLGTEVGVSANAIIRRLALESTDAEVVLGGGVFKGRGPLLLNTVTQVIHQMAPHVSIVLPEFEPVVGAVLLALESLGITVDQTVYSHLRGSLRSVLRPE